MSDSEPTSAELDALVAALAQLRGGGRGGWPPFDGGPFGRGPSSGPSSGQSGQAGRGHDGGHGRGTHSGQRHALFGPGGPFSHGPGPGGAFGPDGPFGPGPGPGGPFGRGGRGAGPARLRLLDALAAASHPLTVSEVGDAIGVDQPRASRLIQQAVDQGLVRREADPDDARRTRVALTGAGQRLAGGLRKSRREQLTGALADFTPAERAELVRLLTKLAAAWPEPPPRHAS